MSDSFDDLDAVLGAPHTTLRTGSFDFVFTGFAQEGQGGKYKMRYTPRLDGPIVNNRTGDVFSVPPLEFGLVDGINVFEVPFSTGFPVGSGFDHVAFPYWVEELFPGGKSYFRYHAFIPLS